MDIQVKNGHLFSGKTHLVKKPKSYKVCYLDNSIKLKIIESMLYRKHPNILKFRNTFLKQSICEI